MSNFGRCFGNTHDSNPINTHRMENIWIFLIVAGVMGFRAFIEKSKKELDGQQQPDLSDVEMPELHFPQQEPEPLRGHSPLPDPLPEEGMRSTSSFTRQAGHHTRQSGHHTRQSGHYTPPSPCATPQETDCEFANPSPEELRRAVIWSEILQRKY